MVRLMEAHGMEVEWESREGKGHSFDFEPDEPVAGLLAFLGKHLLIPRAQAERDQTSRLIVDHSHTLRVVDGF